MLMDTIKPTIDVCLSNDVQTRSSQEFALMTYLITFSLLSHFVILLYQKIMIYLI